MGRERARFSLAYVPELRVNGWFYLFDARFPAAFTLLALIGLSGGSRRPPRPRRPCRSAGSGWPWRSISRCSSGSARVYAGSYNYGADVPIRS